MANCLKLNKVSVELGGENILSRVVMEVPVSGVTVLMGANGAGKSTLLRLLAGLVTDFQGDLAIPASWRRFWVPEPANFYAHLTVQEQLAFVAQQHLSKGNKHTERVEATLTYWGLTERRDQLTKNLSLGYRQRLSMAQVQVIQPDLLLLDEPMNGMDPETLKLFKSHIRSIKMNTAILMSSHIMTEAQELADWLVVMDSGQVLVSQANDPDTSFHSVYQKVINERKAEYA